MRYFTDMIVGLIVGIMVEFIIDIFYYPSIFLTYLIMGVLFPCIMLGTYSIFRYGIAKEKPATEPYVIGNITGYVMAFEVLWLIHTCYPELFIFQIAKLPGINPMAESFYQGTCELPLIAIVPVISAIFLHFLWKSKPLNIDKKEKKKGKIWGFAFCFPVMAYSYIALVLQKYPEKYAYEAVARHPVIIFIEWLRCLSICLFVILIAYWVERGKNIRTVLILYVCEAMIFFACIKIFHLNFPASPLAGLSGTIVLGAVIYKGLEKLFAFVKERGE